MLLDEAGLQAVNHGNGDGDSDAGGAERSVLLRNSPEIWMHVLDDLRQRLSAGGNWHNKSLGIVLYAKVLVDELRRHISGSSEHDFSWTEFERQFVDINRGAVRYQTNLRGVWQNVDGQLERFLDLLQLLFFDADVYAEYQYLLFLLDLLELVFHGSVLVVQFRWFSLLGYFSVR